MILEDLTKDDIFGMTENERAELIKASVELYIQQVEMGALLVEVDFVDFLKSNIVHTEKKIEQLSEEEEYEVCYFLKELINNIKERYGLLL